MRLGAIAFLIGILLLQALPELPSRLWTWALPVAVLVGIFIPLLRLPVWIIVGFLYALLSASSPDTLPTEVEGTDLRIEGWIASIPDHEYRSVHFEFTADRILHGEQSVLPGEQRLRLSWWNDGEADELPASETHPVLRIGDRWNFTVRLKRPHGLLNPGGFDYERWLYAKGIIATGTVRSQPSPQLLIRADRYPLDRYRQHVAESFERLLPGNPYTGILIALAVGEESGISPRQWDVFNRAGVGHLMSVSGSHIGLVAGALFGLIGFGWSRIPALTLRLPASRAAALAALIGASGYTLLSGLSVPAQRSLLMAALALAALIFQRHAVPSRILALALLGVLILDPNAPLQAGFWLSFGAVAAILYSIGEHRHEQRWWSHAIRLQINITLAMLPPTLIFFQQFPLSSPLANLIAIPWVGCTVLPMTLLTAVAEPFGAAVQTALLESAALTMEGLWHFLTWLDRIPGAVLYRPVPPLWTPALALPGLTWLLAPRGLPNRWLGALLCLPLLWPPTDAPPEGGLEFTLLDVGQGLSAVVRTQHHTLVYDAGPRLGTTLDAGRAVITPFLRQKGALQVDMLIVSHNDSRHTGGVRSLRELMPITRILTSAPEQTPIDGAEPCRAGQTWDWDGVRFRILHPPPSGFSGDNASCVLQVESAAGRILLPGDLETAAATVLVADYGAGLAADILVAPHHGHRRLPAPEFLAAVQPRYALFATGYRNRFGYPRPDTVTDYQATGAMLLDSGREGAITFRLQPGAAPTLERYRRDHRRYWTAQ